MASMTKGIEIKAVICKITVSCILAASGGAVIIQGNGKVITNQISESKMIISSFFFVFCFIPTINFTINYHLDFRKVIV
jgi:hypothetical protein